MAIVPENRRLFGPSGAPRRRAERERIALDRGSRLRPLDGQGGARGQGLPRAMSGPHDTESLGVGHAVRSRFSIFEHTTYANSCSQGALSLDVRKAYEQYLAGWDEHGAEWEHWVERAETARATFGRLIGAEPSEVAVTTSVSQAVSALVSALPLERGRNRIV